MRVIKLCHLQELEKRIQDGRQSHFSNFLSLKMNREVFNVTKILQNVYKALVHLIYSFIVVLIFLTPLCQFKIGRHEASPFIVSPGTILVIMIILYLFIRILWSVLEKCVATMFSQTELNMVLIHWFLK